MKVWWEYIGEELALFWESPYGHGKEKIARFWWPVHPPEATAEVERSFEAIAQAAQCMDKDERIVALEAELAAERLKVQEAGEQLEFDRTALCDVMNGLKRALDSRYWLTEGRGSYEWNDDRFREEFTETYRELRAALAPLAKIAASWKACPRKAEDVAKARIDLKVELAAERKRREEAESERDHARKFGIENAMRVIAKAEETNGKNFLDDFMALRVRAESAERERDELRRQVEGLREALKAVLVMWDRGPSPRKLDEALTWRENDERARVMASAALAASPEPPASDADAATGTADDRIGAPVAEAIRRHLDAPAADPVGEAVRNCAEIAVDGQARQRLAAEDVGRNVSRDLASVVNHRIRESAARDVELAIRATYPQHFTEAVRPAEGAEEER